MQTVFKNKSCEAAATPVFLLSLRPQSNVNWFHVYGLTCKMLGDTSRFVRLSSFRLWAFLTTESKSESTNEHMHSGGIHCWKSFALPFCLVERQFSKQLNA